MSARIRSAVPAKPTVDELSRDDLAVGDVVTLSSIDAATTYAWTIVFKPEGSTATFTGSASDASPGSFTVNKVGPYLIRLVVDAGLATESSQYVRLRALTTTLGLTLVAAGERRDETGVIPVDVDVEGWANEQNNNLLALEAVGTTYPYHIQWDAHRNGATTLYYKGWLPRSGTLSSVKVYMGSINTVGSYTLNIQNVTTTNSCLSAALDMNTLVASTVTSVALTATAADLEFAADGVWDISLVSDNAGFDGEEVYLDLVFEVS
jgi:hypothetical protein